MRTTRTAQALTALILGAASVAAVAQPQPPQHRPGPGHAQPAPPHAKPHVQPPHAQPHRPQPPHAAPQAHRPGPGHAAPPGHAKRMGAGPDHRWTKGTRVPPQYRTPHYVVHDWQRHGLKRPGRGQQWIQNGNDYLLVAVASGVIAQMVLGH